MTKKYVVVLIPNPPLPAPIAPRTAPIEVIPMTPMAIPTPPVTTPIVPIIAEAAQPTVPPTAAPRPIEPMPGKTKDVYEPVKNEK